MKIDAKLIFMTPLWLVEYCGRHSHDSCDKMVYDDSISSQWIKNTGHDALLKMGDLYFELSMPRAVLLEFEKYYVGMSSPNDLGGDINKSTRYTLKKLIKLIEECVCREDDLIQANEESMEDASRKYREAEKMIQFNIQHNCFYGDDTYQELANYDVKKLVQAYRLGNNTPDKIKCFLPENWCTKGVYKISLLTLKNMAKQRYNGETGKPYFLIKRLFEEIIDALPEDYKKIVL